MTRYADAVLALTSLIWGAMFVIAKAALADVSSAYYLALRFTLAAAVLGTVFRKKLVWSGAGFGLGAVLMLGYLLQTVGLRTTTPAKSAFLTGGYIVMVPFFSWFVYRNVPRVAEMIGVVTAAAGMGLLTMQAEGFAVAPGDWLTIGGAAAFAVHIVLLGHLAARIPSEGLTFLQISGAAALAWGLLPWEGAPTVRWRPAVVLAIVAGALLATALAFYLQTWAQQYVSPTRAALIFALEPVFAWIVAWWWTGEVFTPRAAAGAALILAGVVIVELKPNRRAAHPLEK